LLYNALVSIFIVKTYRFTFEFLT